MFKDIHVMYQFHKDNFLPQLRERMDQWWVDNLTALRWRHNGRDGVSNHQPHDCLFNSLFRRESLKSSAPLPFVHGIHRWPVNSPHKGPVTRKCFHLLTSSWTTLFYSETCLKRVLKSMVSNDRWCFVTGRVNIIFMQAVNMNDEFCVLKWNLRTQN